MCAALILLNYGLSGFPAWNNDDCIGWSKCDGVTSAKKAGGPTASTGSSAGATSSSNTATRAASASGIMNYNNKISGGKKRQQRIKLNKLKHKMIL